MLVSIQCISSTIAAVCVVFTVVVCSADLGLKDSRPRSLQQDEGPVDPLRVASEAESAVT